MEKKQMSFMAAMKDFFGVRPGQTPMDFLKEIKALSIDEREFFKTELGTVGYEIIASN